MTKYILTLLSGLLFGLGLALSNMVNPVVVQNFLDVAGSWDASLIFVMGGALVIVAILFPLVLKREKPLQGEKFNIPTKIHIDKDLILGASIFGIGWGLAGYCPGPALVGLVYGQTETILFVIAMLVGFKVSQLLKKTT